MFNAEVVHVLLTRSPPRADSRAARPGPGAGRTPCQPQPGDDVLILNYDGIVVVNVDTKLALCFHLSGDLHRVPHRGRVGEAGAASEDGAVEQLVGPLAVVRVSSRHVSDV